MSLRVCLVVDSGTDVRLADGLAGRSTLRILARRIASGREISQATRQPLRLDIGPAGHAAFAWFVFRRLVALRREVDVIVVQGYGPAAAAANLAGRLTGRPALMLVCSPVEAYYRCRARPGSGRRFRAVEYRAISLVASLNARLGRDGYIVLSPYLASIVRARTTARPIDVIAVYGVDGDVFHPSAEPKAAIRARLGVPDGMPLVFFSSRVAPEKDAATVLCAVKMLADAGRPVRLLHLSGGHRELVALAVSTGVEEHVVAGDAVAPFASLADYYRASDVCVQSSFEEGLGFSPLEALACGVPVVATAVGGLRDTIRDGETGWQIPTGDPDALARAIGEVLDNPAEAARRTAQGARMVERTYERRVVFDAFLDRLARAASRGTA